MIFDTCVLVASNRSQAANIRSLIDDRRAAGLYPQEIDFVVLSDPDNGRVGSGGATLLALSELEQRVERSGRILIIHAGGESRRMPAYAPEGKLFAPLSVASSSALPPVILDLQLSLFLKYPWKPGEVLVASGDVVIDFDTDLIPEDRGEIYGFAKGEDFEVGSKHGVFKFNRNRSAVVDFFQKASPKFLAENAALEGARGCALDLGIVGFSQKGVRRFLALGRREVARRGRLLDLFKTGELFVDLYLEVLIACLSGLDFADYRQKVHRGTRLDEEVLRLLFDAFSEVDLRATLVRRATFLHFGSLAEYPASCAALTDERITPFYTFDDSEVRPSVHDGMLQFNSVGCRVVSPASDHLICMEGCRNLTAEDVAGDNLFVGLTDRILSFPVPSGICLDERNTSDGRFLLAYHRDDVWRPTRKLSDLRFCGVPFDRWLSERRLAATEARDEDSYDLYDARLFIADAPTEFIEGYWRAESVTDEWLSVFESGRRYSLREIGALSSARDRERHRTALRQELLREEVLSRHGWLSLPGHDFQKIFGPQDSAQLVDIYRKTDDDLIRLYRHRLLSGLLNAAPETRSTRDSQGMPSVDYLAQPSPKLRRGVKLDQIVWARAPVRLDLAGGWTDTPPYTLREGGEVTNLAVNLNGQPPIQVFCRPTVERTIRIQSIDVGAREEIADFAAIEDFTNPASPFALPKAALFLLGMTREASGKQSLFDALEEIGCGLEITLLSAVPKGSGLGTSSILGATILAALERFFGVEVSLGELIRQVLQMEQMLTTGGGWQDQIGGIAGGVKYIQTTPGLRPEPLVYQIDPFVFDDPASAQRFTLYYTGVTRLAKNILADVVDRVNTMEPAYRFTLRSLKELARSARDAISLRNLDQLAGLLRASWKANKLIHASTTNDEVERLLKDVSGLYSGMKLLGAGGGGYVLFLSESVEQAEHLRERLAGIDDERARIVGMSLNPTGLQVSVS